MSSAMKNIVTILTLFTVAFAAYYFYVQNDSVLDLDSGEDQEMLLIKAQQFLDLSAVLASIKLDTSILNNDLFNSYQSFTKPVVEESFGRENPFLESGASLGGQTN
jgi:hypothetical protein